MNLREKAEAVKALFDQLGEATREYHQTGGLGCLSGCGMCCSRPTVPATVLEFIPFAMDCLDAGVAEEKLAYLHQNPELASCINYATFSKDRTKGFCTTYTNRGMICRLFASAARRNKEGKRELLICKPLKEERAAQVAAVTERIRAGETLIPLATEYYQMLSDIDPQLTVEMPINDAIRLALELVLRDQFYSLQAEEVVC
ncbi:YkgJ family cysteine cluster protein [Algoriphagus namhaensis]